MGFDNYGNIKYRVSLQVKTVATRKETNLLRGHHYGVVKLRSSKCDLNVSLLLLEWIHKAI